MSTDSFPKILPARWKKPDQERLAHQKQRLDELAEYLPKGDAERGEKLFDNRDRSKCITCHLKGEKGVRLGPDLTWIGAIRSERGPAGGDRFSQCVHCSLPRGSECRDEEWKGGLRSASEGNSRQDVSLVGRRSRARGSISENRGGQVLERLFDARRA